MQDETAGRPPPDVRFEFGHEPDAPRRARKALAQLFRDPDDPLAAPVELAASELVSNVVLHTDDGGAMQAWDGGDTPLRLEVEDNEPLLSAREGEPDESGGRGLLIVQGIADAWGVTPTQRGKTVWAEFTRPAD